MVNHERVRELGHKLKSKIDKVKKELVQYGDTREIQEIEE